MAQPQEYSPTAIQPYEPAVAPPTPDAKPSPLQDSPGFQFQGHGNISHGGAIAGMFDNVLKGFVNDHAMGEAHKALTLKKKSDDLNASYNADAQRLYQMKASGVDEKSPEYQAAKSAVDGSWGALQDFRGGLIDQQGGKKKPSKGAKTGQDDPMMALTNPAASPQEKAAALYAISKKLGPPVYGQIASLNTPAAQQARATQNAQAGVDAQHVTNAMTHEQAQATYNKYAGKTEEEMAALPEAEQQAYRNARAVLLPPTAKGTTRLYASPDGKTKQWYIPENAPEGWNAVAPGAAPKNVRVWKKNPDGKFTSVMVDPATNQVVPGTENGDLAPPGSLSGRITTKDYHYVDSDGNVHAIPETSISRPMAANEGGHSAPPPTSASAAPPTVSGKQAAPAPTRRERVRTPLTPAATPGAPAGDRILGHKGTPDEATAKKNADTLELAARQSLERMKHVTSIGDTGIVFNWVRAQVAGAGRMTNTEIQQAIQSGSFDKKFKNAYDRATKGTLDPKFRREMVEDTLMSARQARLVANSYKPKQAAAARPQSVPSNYVQFKASDGNSHWIDPSKLDAAKKIDPGLSVIQ